MGGPPVSTRSSMEPPSRNSNPSWEPSLTTSGSSTSQRRDTPTPSPMPLSQTPSMQEPTGQTASPSSTTFATSPTADHAGPTEPPRLLTTVLASPPTEPSPSSTLFPTPPHAATSSTASLWAATVDRLAPHGSGSRTPVLFPEETTVMVNSATITPWSSAPITLSHPCHLAML